MRTHWPFIATVAIASSFCSPVCGDIGWTDDDHRSPAPKAQQRQQPQQQRVVTPVKNPNQPDIQQLSEAFGYFIGQDISKQGIHFDVDAVVKGIHDSVAGNPPPMNEGEYEEVVANFRDKHFQEVANFNMALADTFMLSNGKRQDIIQAVPGKVQFTVLQRGRGRQVEAHTTPLLKYTGRFIDGTVFAATESEGALPVPLDDMIPGFREGVIGMREGETRRIFIHPDAAYGVTGDVAPNSLLLFEVEVVKAGSQVPQPHAKQQAVRRAPVEQPVAEVVVEEEDVWDLSLDDERPSPSNSHDDDDEFSSHRIILKPVSYDSPPTKPRQQQQRAQNSRNNSGRK